MKEETVTFSVMYMTAVRYNWMADKVVTHKGKKYRIVNLTDQWSNHRGRYTYSVLVEAVPVKSTPDGD